MVQWYYEMNNCSKCVHQQDGVCLYLLDVSLLDVGCVLMILSD